MENVCTVMKVRVTKLWVDNVCIVEFKVVLTVLTEFVLNVTIVWGICTVMESAKYAK